MLKFGVFLPFIRKLPKIDEICEKRCTFVPDNRWPEKAKKVKR